MEYHLKFLDEESQAARESIPCQLGIDYGYSENEKIDIFGTDLPDDAPTVVFVYGGYWQRLSRSLTSYAAKAFYKEGIKVMVVGYNACPYVSMEKIVEEISNGVRFCLTYAKKIGCRSVALGGHSSGAHLIASVFMNSFEKFEVDDQNVVKAVFLLAGVYDLQQILVSPKSDALNLTEYSAHKLSPLAHPIKSKNKSLKFKIFSGADDIPTLNTQSEDYHKKLIEAGYDSDICIVEDTDHLSITRKLVDSDYVVVKKVVELLK